MKRSLTLFLVVAALLVGVAGGASAAKLITGKQIKDGTVSGADIKNSTIKGLDVKNGALRGADVKDGTITAKDLGEASVGADEIADGSVGLADLAGGARTVARRVTAGNNLNLATCDSDFFGGCSPVASLNVGGGTWFVQGTITVSNNVSAESDVNTCGLRETTQDLDLDKSQFQLFPFETAGSRTRIALQGVVTTAGIGILQIRCTERAGDTFLANDVAITAISLNGVS